LLSPQICVQETNVLIKVMDEDVNIRWQHGINALPVEEQDGKGRVPDYYFVTFGLLSIV
jgi:hypothetical protein